MIAAMLLAGICLLLGGGTALVRGACGIAVDYGVSPLIVGLTVLAFGTSAPELVVNIIGALRGETALVFGNVVGSNLANIGLVLGAAALMRPLAIDPQIARRDIPLLLLGTAVLLVICMDKSDAGRLAVISRSDAVVLLLQFGIFAYVLVTAIATRDRGRPDDPTAGAANTAVPPRTDSRRADWIYVGAGVAMLALGGELTISNGAELARLLGMPAVVVGMLIVGIGTSLPELITAIIAAWKHESNLCVGNVIGSNIFNILFVLPTGALITPLPVPVGGLGDILLTLALSCGLLLAFFHNRATLNRRIGAALLATFAVYMSIRALP